MTLLIDNNDSFTYNIVELLRKVTTQPIHIRSSKTLQCADIEPYDHIIFSPGPGLPSDFPIMAEILQQYDSSKSILGICLGHQAVCQHYGAQLRNLTQVVHGIESTIHCNPSSLLFHHCHSMTVGRYHSWVAEALPDVLIPTAHDESGLIMAVEHLSKRVYGIQFHPESYITKEGHTIISKFIHGIS